MIDPFDAEPRIETDDNHQLLLGRPCKPEHREAVLDLLTNMSDETRSIVYEWGMFPLDNLAFYAYDQVTNYLAQDKQRINPVAQEATQDYVTSITSWLELIRTSEKVPRLEYIQPEDEIGEEMDFFVWAVEDGGADDPLLAEQIEYLQGQLERYKLYVKGEVRLMQQPESIARNIPTETRQAQSDREKEECRQAAMDLLVFLAPALEATNIMLRNMGIDPVTLDDL